MKFMQKFMNKILGIALLSGLFIQSSPAQRTIYGEAKLKFDDVLELIDRSYVDTVNQDKLVEDAVIAMTKDLDPHSEYMTAKEFKEMNEPLKGNFDGIGVQFNIMKDTIVVQATISGGPSEKLGIMAGDKIIKIEDTLIAGKKITNNDVIKRLRGPKGTKVRISIMRRGEKKLIDYTIVRDKIPIFSVDASYMLTPEIGYIKVNRFAQTTMQEFNDGLKKLQAAGMKHFVLDLRQNSGGYLNTANDLANEFLQNSNLIVYTEGVSSQKKEFRADGRGKLTKGRLVVLIDEGSASASEIVSGAIQDWDRGLIIGRRSFGKGLVQNPFTLRDGSVLKLTTARYYTPSGRCIQRPYDEGKDDYYQDRARRQKSGEYFSKDSIHLEDTVKYYTANKRVVYGGGGVIPDIFIPVDTSENSDYLTDLFSKGVFNQFAFSYLEKDRKGFAAKYPNLDTYISKFDPQAVLQEFIAFAEKEGVKKEGTFDAKADSTMLAKIKKNVPGLKADDLILKEFQEYARKMVAKEYAKGYEKSLPTILEQIKARIASNQWQNEGFYRVINQSSKEVESAIKAINGKEYSDFKVRE
jgi:carboxyl-terminal processing protease